MSRLTLHVDYDFNFELIAIISSLRDYRLCWHINRNLRLDLSRKPDLEITNVKKRIQAYFPFYTHEDEINFLKYYFIGNKSAGTCLIPEIKEADYFLMLRGDAAGDFKIELLRQLRPLDCIEAAFEADVLRIRSKQNLIFD
ncbi:MAG TPA: IPExxxVDY family protein [Chitinophagales bacterium]|nr:IPExxxVDY family protein [Chitinophagales bacterium]